MSHHGLKPRQERSDRRRRLRDLVRLAIARSLHRRDFRRLVKSKLLRLRVQSRRGSDDRVLLVASTKVAAKQVAFAHFCAAFVSENRCRIVAFASTPQERSGAARTFRRFGAPHALRLSRAYADATVLLAPNDAERLEAHRLVDELLLSSPAPQDVERYSVAEIPIGDLVYDEYLNSGHPTIVFDDPVLRQVLEEMTLDVLMLLRMMQSDKIVGVVGQGLAFRKGLPLRVAVSVGIPAYCIAFSGSYRLTALDPEPYQEWRRYPEQFAELSLSERAEALAAAEAFVEESIFGGGHRHAPDLQGRGAWRPDPAASEPVSVPSLGRKSDRKRVLVALHSFSDSPHAPGIGLFQDYLIWVRHLVALASKTDYEWLVKPHPDQRDDAFGAAEALAAAIAGQSNMRLVSPEVGHRQLLAEGLDLVLTMYGTIGFEMPLLGVPVATALPNNPHHRYAYCLHAQTVREYDSILTNPLLWNYPIDRNEILEYVYCAYIHRAWDIELEEVSRIRLSGSHFEDGQYFAEWLKVVSETDTTRIVEDYIAWIRDESYSHREFLARLKRGLVA